MQQRVDPFRVLKMLNDDLIIKLQLFLIMNIHSYVFITQLEFASVGDGFYKRFVTFFFFVINVFGFEFEYEIHFLIQKKIVIKTDKTLLKS